MTPLVWTGAAIDIVRTRDVSLGEIVLAELGDELYCHRVVGREPSGWVLQGDACDVVDGIVPDHEILGRVDGVVVGRWTIPLTRPVATWLRSRIVIRALPSLRAARRGTRALVKTGARRLGRSAIARRLMETRIDVRRLSPTPRGELAQTLTSWGIRPTQMALATWSRRAEGRNGIALLASVADRTRAVVALDHVEPVGGLREGRVDDGFVAGALFAEAASACLVAQLVTTARERGLRTIRVSAAIDGTIKEAFSHAGFAAAPDGALVREL